MGNYDTIGLAALDFSNYVAVNRTLVKKFGLHVAVIIGELSSEARYYLKRGQLEDGWFFSTVENIREATGLSEHYQREAIKAAKDRGLIDVKYKGLPRKRYVRVNARAVLAAMDESAGQAQCFTTQSNSDAQSEALTVDHMDDNNHKEQPQEQPKKERRKPSTFDMIIAERTDNPELVNAIGEFIRMRSRIKKPLTDYALQLRLSKLWRLGKTDEERIAIVNQSVGACWQDFFELKEDNGARQGRGAKTRDDADFSAYAQPKVGDKRIEGGKTYVYQSDGKWKAQEPTIFDLGDEDIDF